MVEIRAIRSSIDAWRSVNDILAMEKQDSNAILSAYRAAVREHPGFAPLLNNYANFLTDVRGNYDTAENFYKRAIDADPKHGYILGKYGEFLLYRSEHERGFDFLYRSAKVTKDKGNLNRIAANDICRAIHSANADRRSPPSRIGSGLRSYSTCLKVRPG